MKAVHFNHIKVIDILLKAGADVDETIEVIDWLIQFTDNLRWWCHLVNDKMMSRFPFLSSFLSSFLTITSPLLFSSPLPFSSPFALHSPLWHWGSSVINALNTAAINGYADIVDCLLAHGANTEIKDEVMQQTNTLFGHPSCISYLIWYSILLIYILFYSILFYQILFYSIRLYSIPFFSTLLYPILIYSVLFYSTLSYSILFYSFSLYNGNICENRINFMFNYTFNLDIDITNCTANDWCVLHSSYIRHLDYYRTSYNALLNSAIFYSTLGWQDCVLPLPSPPLLSSIPYIISYIILNSTLLYSTLLCSISF